jgi:hypothetical protein
MNESVLFAFGRAPWLAALAAAATAALLVDVRYGVERPARRLGRAAAILALAAAAAVAVLVVWPPIATAPRTALPRPSASLAWWMLALPVFALGGSWGGRPGARAVVRLVAASAAPAILLGLCAALRVPALAVLAAGTARAAAAPLHPLAHAAAEALSPGAFGLVLATGLITGGAAALEAAALLPANLSTILATVLALAAGVAGVAALADAHLLRRIAVWCSVQATLAIVLTLIATPEQPERARAAVSHLGASAAALPLFTFVLGRIVTWARIADLGAHGGLLGATVARAQAVLAAVAVGVFAGVQAPLALVRALRAPEPLSPLILVIALAGWIGVSLSLLLGAYRIVRGRRIAPGEPVPEIGVAETMILAGFFVLAVSALLLPDAWRLPSSDLGWLRGGR